MKTWEFDTKIFVSIRYENFSFLSSYQSETKTSQFDTKICISVRFFVSNFVSIRYEILMFWYEKVSYQLDTKILFVPIFVSNRNENEFRFWFRSATMPFDRKFFSFLFISKCYLDMKIYCLDTKSFVSKQVRFCSDLE